MAYLPPDEDEQQKAAAGHPLLASFGTGSGGATISGGRAPTIQQPSSGFVPFSAYANANQGSAQKMAQGLASDVTRDVGAAQLGTANERNAFNDQVKAGSPFYKGPAQALASWGGLSQQAAPSDLSAPKRAYEPTAQATRAGMGQAYTGPTQFGFSQGARDATTRADEELRNATTNEGRQALLQKKYGGQGYTRGESRLDAALTGNAAGNSFDALKAKYGDLVGQMGQAEQGANQYAAGAKATTQGIAGANADLKARQASINTPYDPNAKKPTADTIGSARWYQDHPGDRTKRNFWDNSAMDYDAFMKTPGGLARDYRPQQNAFRETFGNDSAQAKAVFDSLTQEEFDNLEKMLKASGMGNLGTSEQVKQWLRARAHDLGVDGQGNAINANPSESTAFLGGG